MKKFVYAFKEGNATMRNLLGGKGANLADDVARLGSNVNMPALTDKATEILKYETKLSDGSAVITVMGDKLRSIVDSSGNKISVDK